MEIERTRKLYSRRRRVWWNSVHRINTITRGVNRGIYRNWRHCWRTNKLNEEQKFETKEKMIKDTDMLKNKENWAKQIRIKRKESEKQARTMMNNWTVIALTPYQKT
jgi:hypothetical protein